MAAAVGRAQGAGDLIRNGPRPLAQLICGDLPLARAAQQHHLLARRGQGAKPVRSTMMAFMHTRPRRGAAWPRISTWARLEALRG